MSIIQEHFESKDVQARQEHPFMYLLGQAIGWVVRAIFGFIRWSWLSILWVCAAVLLMKAISGFWGKFLAIAVLLVPIFVPQTRRFSFAVHDWQRFRAHRYEVRALENGNKFLRRMGLVHDDDTTYNVALYFGADECVLACREMIPGLAPQRLIDSCKAFMTDLDAQSVRSENLGGGLFNIHFILSDPLDASTEITQPKPLDLTDMSVEIGKDAFGDPFRLKLKDTAGVLVGGVPGSGKSAFLNAALGSYALATDDVSMTVIDCKGGQDFSAYESRVDTFISEATDFTEVRDVLRNTVEEMNKRVKTNGAVLGESNFWNVAPSERRSKGVKMKLIVIDEAQALFDLSGITDKEEKKLRQEITRACTDLVKRGRSAGVLTIFATQKPTADAIPTAIRDNVNVRIALRVTTSEAERAIMGYVPDELDVPRATSIPASRKGGAVIESEGGTRKMIRSYYFPEKKLRAFLAGHGEALAERC